MAMQIELIDYQHQPWDAFKVLFNLIATWTEHIEMQASSKYGALQLVDVFTVSLRADE